MSCFLRFLTRQILSTAGGLTIQNSHDKNNSPRFPAISGIWLNANRRWTMFRFYMLKDLPDHFDLHKVLASILIGLMPIPKSLLGILLGKEFRFWIATKNSISSVLHCENYKSALVIQLVLAVSGSLKWSKQPRLEALEHCVVDQVGFLF